MKKIINILLIISIIFLYFPLSCNAGNSEKFSRSRSVTDDPISPNWENKYPQLTKINFKNLQPQVKIISSQRSLVGHITNQFGIRDEILKNIVDTIPATNYKALYFAIKYAQDSQATFLLSDKINASQPMGKMMHSIFCLSSIYGIKETHNLILKTVSIRTDNQARLAQERMSEKLMSGKIISLNNALNNDCSM